MFCIVTHVNLRHFQLKRYDVCCCLYKELCSYELKYKLPYEQQMYLFMIQRTLRLKATAAVLQRLTQPQLMKIVMAPQNLPPQFKSLISREEEQVSDMQFNFL